MSAATEGYTTQTIVPPDGALPHTGADLGPDFMWGGLIFGVGVVIMAAVNGWRTPRGPRLAVAPSYLQSPIVPSTWNQE